MDGKKNEPKKEPEFRNPHNRSVSMDDSEPSLLGELRTLLANRVKGDSRQIPTPGSGSSNSSNSAVFKFRRSEGVDGSGTNIAKGEVFVYMTIPPDGGYGWLILLASFLSQVITDAVPFATAILLPYIGGELNLSFKQTALIASSQIGFFYLSAPIGSAFINKYGFRPVAIFAALTAAASIFAASFSNGTIMLVLFFGMLAGPAMGLFWVASSLIVNYYFERYRALVGGLASSGAGIGVMLITIADVQLVEIIGWRNTTRINAVIMIIAGLLAVAYREVEPTKVAQFFELAEEDTDESGANSVIIGTETYSVYTMHASEHMRNSASSPSVARNLENRISYQIEFVNEKEPCWRRHCACCFRKKRQSSATISRRYVITHDVLDRDDIFYDGDPDYSRTQGQGRRETNEILILPGKEHTVRTINYTLSVIKPTFQGKKRGCLPPKIKSALEALFDIRLLNRSEFRLLLLVALLFPMGFNIPYVYSICRAEIPKEYADKLPVVLGLTNVIYRIIVGFVAFKIKVHEGYLVGFGMILGGAFTLASGFVGQQSIVFQFIYIMCFAIGIASNGALRSILYCKVVGLEKLTNAFGLTSMTSGVGAFVGTNAAGFLNDQTGGYSMSFVFSGLAMLLAGLINISLPKYLEWQQAAAVKKAQKKVRFSGIQEKKTCWQKCCST